VPSLSGGCIPSKGTIWLFQKFCTKITHESLTLTITDIQKLVRKELKVPGNHKIELENLAILSHLRHPNIVELLASYSHNDKNNLIFPLAEDGSLFDLFKQERPTTCFKSRMSFLSAIAGLASAIEQVHDFAEYRIDLQLMGCHYDLRPKNILVTGDRFILTDFGLSRFKEPTEDSAKLFEEGGGDYRAPECEDIDGEFFQKHMIRRSSDIWSFGCVLAELVTYMIRGSIGVAEFKASRRFWKGNGGYSLFHCGLNESNTAVAEQLLQLGSSDSRTDKMLVELIEKMLSMDAKSRPRAREVTGKLRLIALCEMSEPVNQFLDDYLRKNSSSLDALIERTRIQSWQYALGILEKQHAADMATEAATWHWSDFTSILSTLKSIQDLIKSLSSLAPSQAPFYHLTELNDRLDDFLVGDMNERSQLFFRVYILENKDEPALQHIQDNTNASLLPTEIRMRAALKHMNELAMGHSERDTCMLQIDEKRIKIPSGYKEHITGHLLGDSVGQPILVEWRDFGRQSADKTVQNELLVRADAIAEMLGQKKPEEFCALHCRGFFHSTKRSAFGLVFDFPQIESLDPIAVDPRSLHNLLEQTSGQPKLHPTLDDRFWVAHKLCRAVLEFHMVDWLHKSLSSFNVMFFPTSGSLEDDWFRQPYVVGFSHSRPDEVSSYSGGPESSKTDHYQHPWYFVDKRYRAEYNYYSLGLVLLEIELWTPLSVMIKKYPHFSSEQIRQHLIGRQLPFLKKSMGRHYYEAVKSCLQGGFSLDGFELNDKLQTADVRSLRLQFNSKVVKRLAKLVEGL
jgi:serine/threonine protein kinase